MRKVAPPDVPTRIVMAGRLFSEEKTCQEPDGMREVSFSRNPPFGADLFGNEREDTSTDHFDLQLTSSSGQDFISMQNCTRWGRPLAVFASMVTRKPLIIYKITFKSQNKFCSAMRTPPTGRLLFGRCSVARCPIGFPLSCD